MTIHHDISSRGGFEGKPDPVGLGVEAVCGIPVGVHPLRFGAAVQNSPTRRWLTGHILDPVQPRRYDVH
jgi:hypothetical protein